MTICLSDMTLDQKQVLKELAAKYELTKDHFFITKHFVVINKIGVERIAKVENIEFMFEVIDCSKDYAAVECHAGKRGGERHLAISYASAHAGNSQNNYYLEMAIKRAKAKAVLEIVDAYSKGVYSEQEADEFKQENPDEN